MANEDQILFAWRCREHAREVREVWRSVAASVAGCTNVADYGVATRWADSISTAYDQKFRPEEPV